MHSVRHALQDKLQKYRENPEELAQLKARVHSLTSKVGFGYVSLRSCVSRNLSSCPVGTGKWQNYSITAIAAYQTGLGNQQGYAQPGLLPTFLHACQDIINHHTPVLTKKSMGSRAMGS